MVKISLSLLPSFFEAIANKQRLYLPVENAKGQAEYRLWEKGVTYSDACNTVRSAKDFFFPNVENLVDFKREGKKIEVIDTRSEAEDFVLFGVRACDVRSFDILDRVFLADPVDTYYQNRRAHATIVSIACNAPESTCFCQTFGIDCADPEGDVAGYLWQGELLLDAKTDKGEALLTSLGDLLTPCDDEPMWDCKTSIYAIKKQLPLQNLTTDGFGGDKMMDLFDSEKWASLSEACLGCGTCTFVCPTCQCYDIRDFDTGHGIKRYRCWDSCMYSDFTLMAHGNSRVSQLERFRQRFMHKLVYYPANNDGIFGCVGCGRCLAKCPISMNIVKVMNALKEEEK